MDNCLIQEVVDFVEVIPVVKKYEWGRKEKLALTKVFYRNTKQIEEIENHHHKLNSSFNIENGDTSNSIEPMSEDKMRLENKESYLLDCHKKRLIENEQYKEKEDHDEQDPYAELWYGSHISSPSPISFNGKIIDKFTLDDVVSCNFEKQALIKSNISFNNTNPNSKIPFLLKILSISKPLSLQVHPDKVLAKELHSTFPRIYFDDNHKPEIAIALSEFETFCGFRDTIEILSIIENFPETFDIFGISLEFIKKTISEHNNQQENKLKSDAINCKGIHDQSQEDSLSTIKKNLFINMLNSKTETINNSLNKLVNRLGKKSPTFYSSSSIDKTTNININNTEIPLIEDLILRLHYHFPLDIGIISPILLNYYKLNTGDAVFIGAGTIHSYISGECLECMANSDNVIRCGLTPKFKDVPTLIRAVNFKSNNYKVIPNHEMFSPPSSSSSPSLHLIDYFVDSVQEYHVKILSMNFNNSCNSLTYLTSKSSPYTLLLCLSGDCTVSFNEKTTKDSCNNSSLSLSHCNDHSNQEDLVFLQGKAILTKCNTEIYLHHLSKQEVKFAVVTLPDGTNSTS
ncbi:Phosphomannose isomerase type I family protein [Cryptosporidium meleagridis]|uniref:mannose-6-phosphate isomerase n=1 Tax=Cryptosporidium meleagridis TaxID=93969 RepID=A0A2P4Z4N4_9CRYT|nr:Phosphomannose isomerase type I family protein [Cryptosporidium meleagridis]